MKKRYLLLFLLCLINTYTVFGATNIDVDTQKGTVYEYYVDVNGQEIKDKTITTVNGDYVKSAPEIAGYSCINARINENDVINKSVSTYGNDIIAQMSQFSTDGDYVIFIYAEDNNFDNMPDDFNLTTDVTIKYYDYNTGKVIETVEETEYIGSNYSISPKASKTFDDVKYSFYEATPDTVDNEVNIFVSEDEEDNVIKLYYKQGSSKDRYITVKQMDVETNEEIDTDIISNVSVGTKYSYDIESIGGYTFVSSEPSATSGNKISITVDDDNDDNVIYCYYRKNYSDKTEWYNDNNQYYVSPTDTYFNDYNYYVPVTSPGIPLNKNENYSFVTGYSDGSFRPNNYITRAEASQMFYNVSADKSIGKLDYYYKDLNTTDWYYNSMYYLSSKGIMNGYSDKTIKPNNYITRAEFIKMATKIVGFNNIDTSMNYKDVKYTDWYYDYVKAGASLGLIDGYSDGTFRPNDYITRAEAVKIIDNMIGRTSDKANNYSEVYFTDVSYSYWSYPYIKMAVGKVK